MALDLTSRVTTLRMGEHYISLEISEDLGDFFEEVALKELRETEDNRERGLEEVRRLLNGECLFHNEV